MTNSQNLELVLVGWIDARRRQDLDAIKDHLRPDVVWQGVRPDLVCPDRDHVLSNLRHGLAHRPSVEALDLLAEGDQVLLGVRSPDFTEIAGEPLDGEIYELFTIEDGFIARIEEFKTRESALEAMREHRAATTPAESTPPSRTPDTPVTGLIPFIHVSDIEASIAYYELLGLTVIDTYQRGGRLEWAALRSDQAQLMLAAASAPIDAGQQAVLFYLYTDDLHALQQHLRAHGAKAGAIRDGTPGPKQEMSLRDPDGYCLMVAQNEPDP